MRSGWGYDVSKGGECWDRDGPRDDTRQEAVAAGWMGGDGAQETFGFMVELNRGCNMSVVDVSI